MKIKILKETDDELKLEVEGEGHSILNLLQKTILEDNEAAKKVSSLSKEFQKSFKKASKAYSSK